MRRMTAKMKASSTDSKEYVCCLLYSFFCFFSPLFFMIEWKSRKGMRSYQIKCLDKLFHWQQSSLKIIGWSFTPRMLFLMERIPSSFVLIIIFIFMILVATFVTFFSHRLKHRKQDNIRQENARSLNEEAGQEQRQVHIIIIIINNKKKKQTNSLHHTYIHLSKHHLRLSLFGKKEKSLCVLWMPTESLSFFSSYSVLCFGLTQVSFLQEASSRIRRKDRRELPGRENAFCSNCIKNALCIIFLHTFLLLLLCVFRPLFSSGSRVGMSAPLPLYPFLFLFLFSCHWHF